MRKVATLVLMLLVAHIAMAQCEHYDFVTREGCDSVAWNGAWHYASRNNIMDTLEAADGCDSIVVARVVVSHSVHRYLDTSVCDRLWLFGSAYEHDTDSLLTLGRTAEGCDSVLHLHLRLRYSNDYDTNITACDSYRWENAIFTTSQNYTAMPLTNRDGCDSNIHLHITMLYSSYRDTLATACDSLMWRGQMRTEQGLHTHVIKAANGCDSVLQLQLTINDSRHDHDTATACDFYRWHDSLYLHAGTHIDTLPPTSEGCLYTETLHLTLRHSSELWIDTSVCDSLAWHANLFTRSVSNVPFASTNRDGCDSVEHLTVYVRHSSTATHTVEACDSYQWHDSVFMVSTIYEYHALNTEGCDSLSTLNLTLYHSDTTLLDTTVCDGLLWHDSLYAASTVDTFIINDAECHGMEVLHLHVGHNSATQHVADACDSLIWCDSTYRLSTSASHTFTTPEGCDSVVTMAIIIRQSTAATEDAVGCGHYIWHGRLYVHSTDTAHYDTLNVDGCDSVVTLHLALRGHIRATDTIKACDSAYYAGRIYVGTTLVDSTLTTTAEGCDSTTLIVLSIGYSGRQTTVSVRSCGPYRYHDSVLLERDTVLTSLFTDDYGCTYAETLMLRVYQDSAYRDSLHACNQYMWGGRTMTYDTTIITLDTTDYGCRLERTLVLAVGLDHERVIDTVVCESLTYNGIVYDRSVYNARFSEPNATGCSDITRLTVRVLGGRADSTLTACSSVSWRGTTYIATTDVVDSVHLDGGCDSIKTMHIVINHAVHNVIDTHACGILIWGADQHVYDHSASFADTLHLANGCDSINHVFINIDTIQYFHTEAFTTDVFFWQGEAYSQSGEYSKRYTSASGCDSILVLHLVITDMPSPEIFSHDDRLLLINHYPYGENEQRVDYYGYRWYKDGELIANATGDSYQTVSGAALNGCYNAEAAVDEQLEVWLSSNVICVGSYGIASVGQEDASLMFSPNPVKVGAPLRVMLEGMPMTARGASLMVYDAFGRQVASFAVSSSEVLLPLSLPSGLYHARLVLSDGRMLAARLLVVR